MEFIWVLVAFACGFLFKQVGLPTLIGYLAAGFGLHAVGVMPAPSLQTLADLGILLMLFTIGLKINIKHLLKPEVWATSLGHMAVWTAVIASFCVLLAMTGLVYFVDLSWQMAVLVGFALSFSSTVCVVKILEEKGEMRSRHGRIAIGVLVIQDLAAVAFLVVATGKIPEVWALLLFGLPLIKPFLGKVLASSGHGEMLPLTGFFLALGGYELFDIVGMKGDLGALVVGMLLAQHEKASELAKSLLNFKDLFLIGFFLSIGFTALPTMEMALIALMVTLTLMLKSVGFFYLFTRFKLRARTSFLSSIALMNFSEFGLIVAALSVSSGWLNQDWLVIIALSVSFSFVLSSLAAKYSHTQYAAHKVTLKRYESDVRLQEDETMQPSNARVLILGMGRVGSGAYDDLQAKLGDQLWGVDSDADKVSQHVKAGRNVILGDAEDADFWEKLDVSNVDMLMLATSQMTDMEDIVEQLKICKFHGRIAAIAQYEDQKQRLLDRGVHVVFNFYAEAGSGFAEQSLQLLDYKKAA